MLSCTCDFDYDSWYEMAPDDFVKFNRKRRNRCISCNVLIDIGQDCLEFAMWRIPYSWVEEKIYGDCVPIANRYMCEKCGEIFLNLTARKLSDLLKIPLGFSSNLMLKNKL